MKKWLSLILAAVLVLSAVSGAAAWTFSVWERPEAPAEEAEAPAEEAEASAEEAEAPAEEAEAPAEEEAGTRTWTFSVWERPEAPAEEPEAPAEEPEAPAEEPEAPAEEPEAPAEEPEAPAEAVAYIMYADGSWANQYWLDGNEYPVTATNVTVTGEGDYTVGLAFENEAQGLAFAALGIKNGEAALPGACLKINAIRVNGSDVAFTKGYTTSDDGAETRVNVYNEWVSSVPAEARSFDGALDDASPIIVDKADFEAVSTVEIDFSVILPSDTAYIMFADGSWANQYWLDGNEYPVTAANATVKGEGEYTVGLTFNQPSAGVAFAAVAVKTGEQTFPGYFIDVKSVKVNGEEIPFGKGYTASDDGVETRVNLYNEWVGSIPADARRADGDLEGVSAIILDKEALAAVTEIEVTFDYIYGEPPAKADEGPMSEEDAKALMAEGFKAYIGVQGKDTYVFRNAWNDNYGLNDEVNPFFFRLTGWDESNNAVDYGGEFADADITGNGEYTVSLTTGEMGFGTTAAFNLLFVSTNIPSSLVKDGYLTIDNVRTKIGDARTQDFTSVDTSGDYVRLVVIDTYNQSSEPFGYTVPGPNETISITFTVSGME